MTLGHGKDAGTDGKGLNANQPWSASLSLSPSAFEMIFNLSPHPCSVARKHDGLVLAVNDAWVELVGIERALAVGKTATEMGLWSAPKDRVRFVAELPNEGSRHSLRLKDGRVHSLRLKSTEMNFDGEPCLVVFMDEVDREGRAERALDSVHRTLQQRVELLEEGEKLARMGHWTNTDEGSTVWWSSGMYAIAGLPPKDELTRVEGRSGIHPDDLSAWVEAREASDNRELEFRWLHPDGNQRWFRTRMGRTHVASTAHSNFGVIQDVTTERLAKERLESQLALMQSITSHVPAVLFQARIEAQGSMDVSFVNDTVKDLLELDAESLLNGEVGVFSHVEPADHDALWAAIRLSATQVFPLQRVVRMNFPTKGQRWCHMTAVPRKEPKGGLLWSGFITDVTESMRASKALERQHHMLDAVRKSQAMFIESKNKHQAFEGLLESFLTVSTSEHGFIGEVLRGEGAEHRLHICAFACRLANGKIRQLHLDQPPDGFDSGRLEAWIERVIISGNPVLSNAPAQSDLSPRGVFTDQPIRSILGMPIRLEGEVAAVVGLANREGGFPANESVLLQPLLGTVQQLASAWREARERQRTSDALALSKKLVEEKSEALRDTLESISQGLSKLDADGNIVLYNQRYLEMLKLPEQLMQEYPSFSEVVKFQVNRGDFGDGFEWAEPHARSFLNHIDESYPVDPTLTYSKKHIRRTTDGRTLEVISRELPDGSSVRTYDDITAYVEVHEKLEREQVETERARALLVERTRELQDTLESISQGLIKSDASGKCIIYNHRFLELLGLPEELMASKPTNDELLKFQTDRGDFGTKLERVESHARGFLANEPLHGVPERYLRKTSDGRTLEFRARIVSDGGIVRTCTDVSSFIASQEALREERQRLEWVIEATRPGIWETDLISEEMTVSLRWAEMLGYTLEELAPITFETWRSRVHPQDIELAMQRRQLHCEGKSPFYECDVRMQHKAGHWMWINTRGRVHQRDENGAALFMSGTHLDVTERVLAEEEVSELNSSLELRVARRTAELERTLRDMEAISYSIAHDLRAPLRAVNGFAAVIAESQLKDMELSQREMFERIVRASSNMGQMLTDLLAVLQVIRAEVVPKPIDMHGVVDAAIEQLNDHQKIDALEVGDLPKVMGDATLLRQVLLNLIDNAVKYADKSRDLQVGVGFDADRKAFYVRDNGVGFDMARSGKLFGLFQRLYPSNDVPGMGVGLAIVSRIIERHGGTIWAESELGKGSTFWWTLPLA